MKLDRYFSRRRFLDLESDDFEGSLKELLKATVSRFKDLERKKLLPGLMQRESTMTTYLGNGVVLPHLRVTMRRKYIFAIGRSKEGFEYEGLKGQEKVHLVVLLLAGEGAKDYLNVLAAVARLVKDQAFVDQLIRSQTLDELHDQMMAAFGGILTAPKRKRQSSINNLMLRQAMRIAKGAHCDSIAVFGDTMASGQVSVPEGFKDFNTVLVSRRAKDSEFVEDQPFDEMIQVRSFSNGRLAQMRSAFLVGLTRGVFRTHHKIACVGGLPGSDQFDTLVVIDLKDEFQALLAERENFMPADVSPEVLERVIGVAMELSIEGREGKPVGTLFVLGDTKKVESMTKPLVLNPFFGYKEEDRNILSPFMDETVKEFSSLDGAFIISGDGVLHSAGSLIHTPEFDQKLPSGLGARHAAGAAISIATDCLAIVVSSSSGQVTVFRSGISLPLVERSLGGRSL